MVCIDRPAFEAAGMIKLVTMTLEGVGAIGSAKERRARLDRDSGD